MLSLPPTVRVFVALAPLDMRGSFDYLAGAVRHLGLDPVDGHLYLFLNKRRRIANRQLAVLLSDFAHAVTKENIDPDDDAPF